MGKKRVISTTVDEILHQEAKKVGVTYAYLIQKGWESLKNPSEMTETLEKLRRIQSILEERVWRLEDEKRQEKAKN